jgi:hypothetical protein
MATPDNLAVGDRVTALQIRTDDNASGLSTNVAVTAATPVAPAITSATTTSFAEGEPGSFTIIAAGTPTPALGVSGALPAGVAFIDNGDGSGTLAGTPAAGTAGTYPLTVSASNGVDPVAQQVLMLQVSVAPTITSAATATFTAGSASSVTVTATGNPLPALTRSGALPVGVTFTDNGNGTATITGSPTLAGAGSWPITITAANGISPNATQAFLLTVAGAPVITSADSAVFTVGTEGSFSITTTGHPAAAITLSGALPAGVTFTDAGDGTGTLAGTPGGGTAGSYPLVLTAVNGIAPGASQGFTLTVTAPSDYAADAFGRVVKNNWGTADLGGAWSVSTARAFAVDGSTATMDVSRGSTRWATLSGVAARDVEVRLSFGPSAVPAGGNAFEYLVARHVSSGNEYRGKVRITSTGAVYAQVLRTVGSTETAISPELLVSDVTATPGLSLKARFRLVGASPTTLDLKVWAAGSAEPSAWTVTTTDSAAVLQAQGAVGVRSYVGSSVSQTSILFRYDDFGALVP